MPADAPYRLPSPRVTNVGDVNNFGPEIVLQGLHY